MRRDFAIIDKDGNVTFITQFPDPTEAIMTAKAIHGEEANAVEMTQYDVHTPAVYRDGVFYNISVVNGKQKEIKAERILTEQEHIEELMKKNEALSNKVKDLQVSRESLEMLVSNIMFGGDADDFSAKTAGKE